MDWQEEKQAAIRNADCVVVKVGSAVLTSGSELNLDVLDNLVGQLVRIQRGEDRDGRGRRVVLVSSGAVSTGRAALGRQCREAAAQTGIAAKQALASIGQGRLMHFYDQSFSRRDAVMSQVLLTRDDLSDRGRFLNARNTFGTLLGWNVIPVVNENDTVAVSELKFSDNDNLASLLLNVVGADLFVNLTSIGGVLDANPLTTPDAKIIPCIRQVRDLDLNTLCGGKTAVGTGGMYSKLLSATRAAQLGVPTFILPGLDADVIPRAFCGEACGTWICPEATPISRRKYWLAYQAEPQGLVRIDSGAADAILNKGKSLLPGGITGIEGDFTAGALIRIEHDGQTVAVGLSNYDAEELRAIMGRSRLEVAALLGDAHYPEVVHRDNMLIEPAC